MAAADNLAGGVGLTSAQVLAYAQRISQNSVDVGVNLCQRFVRMAFGSQGGAATALQAWQATPVKHTRGTPPPGAAVYWGEGAGHAAISAGNGWVYTTDWSEPGKVSLARIDDITRKWGKPLLGWTTQVNERKITTLNAKPVEGLGTSSTAYDPQYSGNGTTAGGGQATGYSKKELRERYGYIAEIYEGVPEIQRLVKMAIRGQWTEEEFDRRFQASKWYKNHTEEERAFVLNSATNPAEVEQQINQAKTNIITMYRQMGVPVGKARINEMAENFVKHGWTEQKLRNAITAEFDYNPKGTFGGQAGQTIDEFRDMAAQYVVGLSNKTMERWTENVLRGEATPDDFASYLKDMAKSQWDDPQLQAAIDRGVTVEQYLAPYQEMAARELEISPEDVNWLGSPKWSSAIFTTTDKGERRIKSLADWQRDLRTNPTYGYDRTTQARDAGAQFAAEFLQATGARG